MRKWVIIGSCVLALVAALGAVTASEEQELSDEEMKELIDAIESKCSETECSDGNDPLTDEQIDAMGFNSLLIAEAWGICEFQGKGEPEQTCVCTEPEPPNNPPSAPIPDWTAIYVGMQDGIALNDTLACKGLYYEETGWSWTVAGGCRKYFAGIEHLKVRGNDSSDIDQDIVKLVREESSFGDCDFADWWVEANYWDSVIVGGRGGKDIVRGSPQGDTLLKGEIVWGYEGDDIIDLTKTGVTHPTAHGGAGDDDITGTSISDYIYGDDDDDILRGVGGNDDHLYGGSGYDTLVGGDGTGDYCDCGPDPDPVADITCEEDVNCGDV